MPELPEVESSVRYIRSKVLGRTFVDVWTDTLKMGVCKGSIKGDFKELVLGKKILSVKRRAKNIIFELSDNFSLLVHYKMTGHLLLGRWTRKDKGWVSDVAGPLRDDKMNSYIRFIFFLDNEEQLAFSDVRKFGKIELWRDSELAKELSLLGPEPLCEKFDLSEFKKIISGKKRIIKPLIMDQKIIAGIGNIYATDALWLSGIHPERRADSLSEKEINNLFSAIRTVLKQGIENRGDSMVDFRLPDGSKGKYQNYQKAYGKDGKKCENKCGSTIKKIKVGGRGTYFCPVCQKK